MRDIHALFFPSICLACGAAASGPLSLCPPCRRRLIRVRHTPDLSPQIDAVYGLWEMDSYTPLRPVLHALKYQHAWFLGKPLGVLLAHVLPRVDALVPVVLHRTRRWERGYDQSVLIARAAGALGDAVGGALGDAVAQTPVLEQVLMRAVPTSPQAKAGRTDRIAGPEGAFRVREASRIEGKTLCLVDDVITTGSTCRAAAVALLEAGAASVAAAAIGVVPPTRDPGPIPVE